MASGGTSRHYCDVRATALRGDCSVPLAHCLYEVLASGVFGSVQAVAGVVLGGCHLASSVSLYATMANASPPVPLDVVFVRKQPKDHGTGKLVESPAVPPGARAVLLEDVVTSGGSSVSAAEVLRGSGFDVVGILSVVDRRPGDRPDTLGGVPFRALFTLEELAQSSGSSGS